MTREEMIDAFTMRLDGYTLQEIGDKYGLTRERIRQMFASITTKSGISRKSYKNYIYPNISDWMIDNNVKQSDLSKKLGCAQVTISSYLTGKREPTFSFINLMLELTKMPYEVVFSKERMEQEQWTVTLQG